MIGVYEVETNTSQLNIRQRTGCRLFIYADTHSAHGEQKPKRGIGIAVCALDDSGRDERSDETRSLPNSVEEGKEHVYFGSGHNFGDHAGGVRTPSGRLKLENRSDFVFIDKCVDVVVELTLYAAASQNSHTVKCQ